MIRTRRTASPSMRGSSPKRPRPMTTSYPRSAGTGTTRGSARSPVVIVGLLARVSSQCRRDDRCDLPRATPVGVDPDGGEPLVHRATALHQLRPLRARVTEEQRACRVESDPWSGMRERDVEKDDSPATRSVLGKLRRALGIENRSAAEGQDAVVLAQSSIDGRPLELPETVLALGHKDLGDGRARDHLDVGVRVPPRALESVSYTHLTLPTILR